MGVNVRERPGKGWYVFINWKKQRKAKFFGKHKALAKAFANKVTAKLKWAEQSGEPVMFTTTDGTMPTVSSYLTEWLAMHAKPHCKRSTNRGYQRAVLQYVIPAFGDRTLHLLKREDIKRFIAKQIEEGKGRGTIQNYLIPLKAAYNQAKEDGLVMVNPVERFGKLLQRSQECKEEIRPLTTEEVQTLLYVAEAQDPALYPILLCAVRTGLRQGELIGLQWGDIDFLGQFMDVRRAVVLDEVTTTKNHKMRRVDLSPQLLAALQREKEIRQLQAMHLGEEQAQWVFFSPFGRRWKEDHLRDRFYQCLAKAGLRRVRFHDLRHTYASLMADTGAPIKYVSKQLGHSSIQVTMDIYSHLFPEGNREWTKKLDSPPKDTHFTGKSATQLQPETVGIGEGRAN